MPECLLCRFPITKRTLSNGLDVIVHEDHQLPMVAVNIWYHVGSKNERPGRTGFAHLFEHLMFEGSEHHDHGFFPPLQRAGGLLNGSTNVDRTNYWEVVPTGALDLALWMESDRMGYLLPALTDQKFNNQRDVVLNERRQNYENRPYGLAGIALSSAMFPPDHPYHWPTIGSAEDIRAARLDHVREFFQTYYHPANASLSLAGDVETEQAFELAEQYFGEPPGRVRRSIACASMRRWRRTRASSSKIASSCRGSIISWHSPAMFAGDDAELDIVADVLAHGKTSRLYKTLVYERRDRDRCVGVSAVARDGRHVPDRVHRGRGSRAAGIAHRDPRRGDGARRQRTDRRRDRARHRADRSAIHLPAADRSAASAARAIS